MPMNNRKLVPQKLPLLLDFAPGAAAAYSLRNLSLNYTGPVVTVRRSTDNAEADFTADEIDDGTLAAWCSGGDGFVKQWWDQSGNARHATQATTTAQPQIVDSGVLVTEGGKPAVQFDGGNDRLGIPSSTATFDFLHASDASVFTAVRIGASANPNTLYGILSTGNVASALVGYDLFYDDRAASGKSDALRCQATNGSTAVFSVEVKDSIAPASQTLISAITNTASPSAGRAALFVLGADLNAVNASTGTPAAAASAYDLSIGSLGGAVYNMAGTISEILIYPTDMTALRTRIEADMAWYY